MNVTTDCVLRDAERHCMPAAASFRAASLLCPHRMRAIRLVIVLCLLAVPAGAQTADQLWQSLLDGNRTFVAGNVTFHDLADLRRESASHQNPPVTILSCSDSRVPPELVFNRSLDQLFVIRVAGNVASAFELASIEYAISRGYTRLIVVLGHEECGAVRASLATDDPPTPSLTTRARVIPSRDPAGDHHRGTEDTENSVTSVSLWFKHVVAKPDK
jgi:carbonic anhydrase